MRQHDVELPGAEHDEVAAIDEVEVAERVDGLDAGMAAHASSITSGESVCADPTVGCTPGPTKRSACSVWPTQ